MFKLAALFSHPVQYFAPLLRELAAQPGVDLTVYYCSRRGIAAFEDPGFSRPVIWDIPLLEGYRYKFLPGFLGSSRDQWDFGPVNPAVVRELCRADYDAIWINGYTGITNWLAMVTSAAKRARIFLRGETRVQAKSPAYRRLPREIVLRRLLPNVAACLYIGTDNKGFYSHYKVPESRLFFTPYSVDNDFFQKRALELKPQRAAIRAEWGICDDRPVILFAGKLLPRKQPLLLLEAYRRLRTRYPCALLFAGDGPLRGVVERTIAEQNIPGVCVTGFLNQTEMPKAYAAADIFVLPSALETWGLVVNEAMNFSLPVVVSDQVGCAPDLVRPGENGYVFPHDSCEQLEGALGDLLASPQRREAYGRASARLVASWDIRHTARGIVQALNATSAAPRACTPRLPRTEVPAHEQNRPMP